MRVPSLRFPVVAAVAFAAGIAVVPATAEDFRFAKLNRTYDDFMPALVDVDEGGVSVKLESTRQTLVLRDHRVKLTTLGGGLFDGAVEIDVQGKGTIRADVAFGPLAERFVEEVVVPPQTLKIAGKVRIARVPGGYEVKGVELPRELGVAVQSPTINAILGLCDQAAIVSLGSIDCAGLESALTRPKVPIPAGQSFLLPDGELSDADRAALDALLSPAPAGR